MLLAFLIAAAAPAASTGLPPASDARADASVRPDALALAAVLNPEGSMADMAMRVFQSGMRAALKTEQAYIDLEKDYPGISDALVEAMSSATKADLLSDMPALQRRYASFYAIRFTPDETAELLRFYGSTLGQRLVAAKHANVDASGLMADIMEDPESEVSGKHIRDINLSATQAVLKGLSADDRAELMAFSKSPIFIKLNQARPAFEQLETSIANEPDPELDKALDAAMDEVFVKFTGEPLPRDD